MHYWPRKFCIAAFLAMHNLIWLLSISYGYKSSLHWSAIQCRAVITRFFFREVLTIKTALWRHLTLLRYSRPCRHGFLKYLTLTRHPRHNQNYPQHTPQVTRTHTHTHTPHPFIDDFDCSTYIANALIYCSSAPSHKPSIYCFILCIHTVSGLHS